MIPKMMCFLCVDLKVFPSHKELLDSGLCDVLVVSTPNMTHCEILMDIVKYPKPHHVLVEKPLCTTVADCRKVRNKQHSVLVASPVPSTSLNSSLSSTYLSRSSAALLLVNVICWSEKYYEVWRMVEQNMS